MASYEEIDYSLRPAKNVERKMIGEALQRLTHLAPLPSYQYVGFGSTYFADFVLFHRMLGIESMTSIEMDQAKSTRFKFNNPYKCIEIKFDMSSDVLPLLDWERRTILWLDYDGKLSNDVLGDIRTFCTRAIAGSVIVVSVNANFSYASKDQTGPVEELREALDSGRVPDEMTDADLVPKWKGAEFCAQLIRSEIQRELSVRNTGRSQWTKLSYKQLFHFHYKDGAKMLTVGGLISDPSMEGLLGQCAFERLPFTRGETDSALELEIPILTARERRYLESHFPIAGQVTSSSQEIVKAGHGCGVRASDVSKFHHIYRYMPNFAEIGL